MTATIGLSPTDIEEMCERVTGKPVAEWERIQSDALMRSVYAGRVKSGMRLSADEALGWMRLYGFAPDDFEATYLPDHDGRRHVEFRLVPNRFPF